MAVKHFSQKKLAELGVFSTPVANASGLLSDVIKFQYQPQSNMAKQESGLGQDGPAGITTEFDGATLTLEMKEQVSIEKLLAYLSRQTVAAYTGFDPRLKFPCFFYANEKAPDTLKRVRSHFVWGAMMQGMPKEISGQPAARQFTFEALNAREFVGAIQVDILPGNATPVTTLTPTKTTMLAWTDLGVNKYALVVLRKDAAGLIYVLDPAAGEYTETGSSITLTTGLGTGESAALAYVCAPF